MQQLAELHYLACFGLVPYSFFGLFLCHHYVVHWLGHILLYVVYYVTLKNKKKTQSVRNRAEQMYSTGFNTQNTVTQVKAFVTNFLQLKRQGIRELPGKMTQDKAEECSPYLKQAFPSESMTQAARNMWLDWCMHVLKTKTVYGFNQVRSDVYDDVLFVHLTKCIHVGSTNVGWWDGGGGGRRGVKRGVRKAWSCKRGNRHRCRLIVRSQWRQEEKQTERSQDWTRSRGEKVQNEWNRWEVPDFNWRVDEMMAGRWVYCTWLSTSMAMSTNMSCSSLMLLSRRTMSLCLDSISLRACLEIPESTIWAEERSIVTTNNSSLLSLHEDMSPGAFLMSCPLFSCHCGRIGHDPV